MVVIEAHGVQSLKRIQGLADEIGVRSSRHGHIVAPRVLVIFYIQGLANGVQGLQRINGPAGESGGCQKFPHGLSWLLLVSFDIEG